MIKHIILWQLSESLTEEEKAKVKCEAKQNLESLLGRVPGLTFVRVNIEPLPSSANCDMMLDTTFESVEALKNYSKHPAHVEVANTYVRPYTAKRTCFDFEE